MVRKLFEPLTDRNKKSNLPGGWRLIT